MTKYEIDSAQYDFSRANEQAELQTKNSERRTYILPNLAAEKEPALGMASLPEVRALARGARAERARDGPGYRRPERALPDDA